MKNFTQNKPAFTMIELVFAIVVLGILSSLAMPRLERDFKQEAADNILANIRYTQHLALMDFKHDFNEVKWQRAFWKITFESCGSGSGLFIGIGSDSDYEGDTDKDEAAIDPSNGKLMFWTNRAKCDDVKDTTISNNIFISKKYGVESVSGSGGCKGKKHIGFDHLGRPHVSFSGSDTPDYSSYMKKSCTFKFKMTDENSISIRIEPETGHAFIVGQEAS